MNDGADIATGSKEDALFLAIEHCNLLLVWNLLNEGINAGTTNADGESILEYSLKFGDDAIIDLLTRVELESAVPPLREVIGLDSYGSGGDE